MRTVDDPGWTFRLLPNTLADLNVEPRGVVHVGAHHGEEVPVYLRCGFGRIVLVEPDPACRQVIGTSVWVDQVTVVSAACAPSKGGAVFHRTADSLFSGLTANPDQQTVATMPVPTVPASTIQRDHPVNVLVVDTQGTELDVLRSANLTPLDLIIVETQEDGPDAYGAYWPDLLAWADGHGWTPAVRWAREHGWADTLLTPGR